MDQYLLWWGRFFQNDQCASFHISVFYQLFTAAFIASLEVIA